MEGLVQSRELGSVLVMPGAGGGPEEGREAGRNQERGSVLSHQRGWWPAPGRGYGTVTWRQSAGFEEWEQEGRAGGRE